MKKGYNISKAEIEKILGKKKTGLELSRGEKSKLGRSMKQKKKAQDLLFLFGAGSRRSLCCA